MATEFILFGTEAVNPAHVSRVQWLPTDDGRAGAIHIHIGGQLRSVSLDDPTARKVADVFGLGELYTAWAKQKPAAEAAAVAAKVAAESKPAHGPRPRQPVAA